MENGLKNLKGARLFPKTFSNHGFGDACPVYLYLTISFLFDIEGKDNIGKNGKERNCYLIRFDQKQILINPGFG